MGVTRLLLALSFFASKFTYLDNENIYYRYRPNY